MSKLFYLILIALAFISGCSSDTSDSDKELDNAAVEVALGGSKTVEFYAEDSLMVTADFYPNAEAKALIILCHQAGFSRAEYKDIAPRLIDSGYACLAIDQRSGNEVYGVANETFKRANDLNLPISYLEARKDVEAAINYAAENSNMDIYVWGSSYSASLALMVANSDERVKKAIAFSPGEYFNDRNLLKTSVVGMKVPVFVTGSLAELEMVVDPITNIIPKNNLVYFKPTFPSDHGSKALNTAMAEEIYTALFDFL